MPKKIKKIISVFIIFFALILFCKPTFSEEKKDHMQEVISTGNILGKTYTMLVQSELSESDLQKALDNLSVYSLLVKENNVKNEYYPLIAQIQSDLTFENYEKQNKDIKTLKYTENLNKYYDLTKNDFVQKLDARSGWALDLGFYTGFQADSFNLSDKPVFLLSGFDKLSSNIPVDLPWDIQEVFKNISLLEKETADYSKLKELKVNISKLQNFLLNYSNEEGFSRDLKDYYGDWKGTLLNQYNEKHNFEFKIDENSITFKINALEGTIPLNSVDISEIHSNFYRINGKENKYFIKLDKKLAEDVLSGEIISSDGKKCGWAAAKIEYDYMTENQKELINGYLSNLDGSVK